jgi:uncharacterized protein (TIGR03435 family)
MNTVQLLAAQPWVERLGATLLHFLWQGAAIAALYAVARRFTARSTAPHVRYVLACAALAMMAAAPVLTWYLLHPPVLEPIAASLAPSASVIATPNVRDVPTAFAAGVYRAVPAPLLTWVVTVWLAGAIVFWMRLLGGWLLAERLRSTLVRPAPPEWQQALHRLQHRIRVARPVRLLVSSLVQAPAVVGWLRPVVLVPVGALAGLPPDHVEALLLHELAHIRRHDYFVNVLQSIVEALLFYHPAVWWISGHIRAEREHCCDDAAVAVTGDTLTYVRALAEIESERRASLSTAMAASGGSLSHRVARLLGQPRHQPGTHSAPGIVAAGVLLAIAAAAVFAQPVNRPKFEVASIKPSQTRSFRMVRPFPGRLTADAPVSMLIQNAYTLQSFQIVGGPSWMDSDHYAIDAKADGNPTHAELFLMLQSLLEDRFQLKVHRETRELPVYALEANKGGLKLASPKEGACVESTPGALPPWAGGRIQPPGRGQMPMAPCGRVGVMMEAGGARMQGAKVGMPEFIRSLSMVLGRTVIDKTSFTEPFDFRLDFLPDEVTSALPPPPPGVTIDSSYPSIVTALREQLGLHLESTKGPVDVLVVDHLERPSAN